VCCRKACHCHKGEWGIVLAANAGPRVPSGGATLKRRCTYRPSVIYFIVNKLLSLSLCPTTVDRLPSCASCHIGSNPGGQASYNTAGRAVELERLNLTQAARDKEMRCGVAQHLAGGRRRAEAHRDTMQISCVAASDLASGIRATRRLLRNHVCACINHFRDSALFVSHLVRRKPLICFSSQLVASCDRDEPTNVNIFVRSALLVRLIAHSEGVHGVCVLPYGTVHVTRQRAPHICASLLELIAD